MLFLRFRFIFGRRERATLPPQCEERARSHVYLCHARVCPATTVMIIRENSWPSLKDKTVLFFFFLTRKFYRLKISTSYRVIVIHFSRISTFNIFNFDFQNRYFIPFRNHNFSICIRVGFQKQNCVLSTTWAHNTLVAFRIITGTYTTAV